MVILSYYYYNNDTEVKGFLDIIPDIENHAQTIVNAGVIIAYAYIYFMLKRNFETMIA